jgi:hypothetical protein
MSLYSTRGTTQPRKPSRRNRLLTNELAEKIREFIATLPNATAQFLDMIVDNDGNETGEPAPNDDGDIEIGVTVDDFSYIVIIGEA